MPDVYDKANALEACVGLTLHEVKVKSPSKVVLTLSDGRKVRIQSTSKLDFSVVGETKPKKTYAIGESLNQVEFGMKFGPFTTPRKCLLEVGNSENDYIVELSENGKDVPIYRWSPKDQNWTLLSNHKKVR